MFQPGSRRTTNQLNKLNQHTMSQDFLPANYETPTANEAYLRFKEEGEYRFRILSPATLGNELWVDHKPIRKPMNEEFTREERENADTDQDGNPGTPKHFWAFAVWHEGRVKILQLNQVTIQREIATLVRDDDWGNPKEYDIVVTRSKDSKKVSYSVLPKPAKPLTDEQVSAWEEAEEKGFNLEALFIGADPFTASPKKTVKKTAKPEEKEINIDDIPF